MNSPAAPSKRDLTRERILNAAARAIRRAGHGGASVAEVMKEAGLTHGGFYAHFKSRDEMVASAMAFAAQRSNLGEGMARLQKKGYSPFRALIESYLSVSHMEGIEQGCVVAALSSEMPRQPELIREAAVERVRALIGRVGAALPEGAQPGAAAHVASTMIGALQMARTLGGKEGKTLLEQNRAALLDRYEVKQN